MDNEAKTCKVCGRLLTLDHYRKTALAPNGVSACKECEGKKRSEIWAAKRAAIGGGNRLRQVTARLKAMTSLRASRAARC